MINWNSIQVPRDKSSGASPSQGGVKPRYMAMGSFHADSRRSGASRKAYKITGNATKSGK